MDKKEGQTVQERGVILNGTVGFDADEMRRMGDFIEAVGSPLIKLAWKEWGKELKEKEAKNGNKKKGRGHKVSD